MPRLRLFLASLGVAACTLFPGAAHAQQSQQQSRPWLNADLPINQRVDDLISQMTLEEKVSQMRDHAPAIPRLGIPKYDWWNEGLHGVAFAGYATNFPQVIGMAATFEAVKAAQQSDVTIAFVGLSPSLEGEEMPVQLEGFKGGDRTSIDLPAAQQDLLKAVAASGKPLIVVLQNGSALAVNWAAEHAAAILEAWYPGEEGGTAIAETLAGDNNPAGRLPLTFYTSLEQVPPFTDYSMKNRTYRYFDGKPLYGFGYGLSYTKFTYSDLKGPTVLNAGDPAKVEVTVTNSGSVAGDDVVELYLTQPRGFETPLRELAGFQRVHLDPKQSAQVLFTVDPRSLGQVDEQGNRNIVSGQYTVYVGGSQPGEGETQTGAFTIAGTKELPK